VVFLVLFVLVLLFLGIATLVRVAPSGEVITLIAPILPKDKRLKLRD